MARRVHGLITTSRISVVRGSGAYPAAAAQPAVAAVLWSCFSVLIFRSLGCCAYRCAYMWPPEPRGRRRKLAGLRWPRGVRASACSAPARADRGIRFDACPACAPISAQAARTCRRSRATSAFALDGRRPIARPRRPSLARSAPIRCAADAPAHGRAMRRFRRDAQGRRRRDGWCRARSGSSRHRCRGGCVLRPIERSSHSPSSPTVGREDARPPARCRCRLSRLAFRRSSLGRETCRLSQASRTTRRGLTMRCMERRWAFLFQFERFGGGVHDLIRSPLTRIFRQS